MFIGIKLENCDLSYIVNCIEHNFIIKPSIHSMLTMDTNILQFDVVTLGMFMEERKIAL